MFAVGVVVSEVVIDEVGAVIDEIFVSVVERNTTHQFFIILAIKCQLNNVHFL